MSTTSFEKFRDIVFDDPGLQAELARETDPDSFTAAVIESARERGLDVDAADVADALNAGRRALVEQWI